MTRVNDGCSSWSRTLCRNKCAISQKALLCCLEDEAQGSIAVVVATRGPGNLLTPLHVQMRAVDLEHAFAKAQAQLMSMAESARLQSPLPTLMLPHTGMSSAKGFRNLHMVVLCHYLK